MLEYAALVVSPHALPDGLIFVFQHPVNLPTRSNNDPFFFGSHFKTFLHIDSTY